MFRCFRRPHPVRPFDRVTPEMDSYREEIFGLVLIVLRAESYEAAVKLINANP